MFLAGHGIAEDHSDAIGVQWALGIAVIFEGFAGGGNRPLLGLVHGIGDARRNGEVPFHGIPHLVADPATDL